MATKKAKAKEAEPETEDDLLGDIKSLPRVESIGVETRVMYTEPKEEPDLPKANIEWRLKSFTPKSKKQSVTMSDLGMSGRARGGVEPARRKRRD
ncbi:MAG: hypothetical protein KC502_04245 [Myxococcales bacterium]|nr:hypothetical protein [Myxococcales bacterium]